MTLSSQLLWNYWSDFHETWYVDRTSYGVMHIGRKFWSHNFCLSYVPWNLENIRKSTNNLSFLCQILINEITASNAGPDFIRSHLFINKLVILFKNVHGWIKLINYSWIFLLKWLKGNLSNTNILYNCTSCMSNVRYRQQFTWSIC